MTVEVQFPRKKHRSKYIKEDELSSVTLRTGLPTHEIWDGLRPLSVNSQDSESIQTNHLE